MVSIDLKVAGDGSLPSGLPAQAAAFIPVATSGMLGGNAPVCFILETPQLIHPYPGEARALPSTGTVKYQRRRPLENLKYASIN